MADYPLTDAQILQLAYRVRGLIRAESKSVPEVPMVDTLEGIESFPVVQKIGGITKYARVPLSLISEGISDINDSRIKEVIDEDYIMGIVGPSFSGYVSSEYFYSIMGSDIGSVLLHTDGITGISEMLIDMWETTGVVGRPEWDADGDISQILYSIGQTMGLTGFNAGGENVQEALDNIGCITLGDFVTRFGGGVSSLWERAGFTGLVDILSPMWFGYSGFILECQETLGSGYNYGDITSFITAIGNNTQAVCSQYGFTGLADLLQEICNRIGITRPA